jgi:hypothetical protein
LDEPTREFAPLLLEWSKVPTILANPTRLSRAESPTSAASRILDAPLPLVWWHLTSLDAPTVAVIWTLAFAWAARVTLPAWVPTLLALAAWSVYVADRLLDVRSALITDRLHRLRLRHHFHWRYRRIFFPLALVAACAAFFIVLRCMPMAARMRNSVLAAAALAYFSGVHSPRKLPALLSRIFSKESMVAILFTTACALPAFSRALALLPARSASTLWPFYSMAFFFTLLAWLNCHAIERWESNEETSLSESSIAGTPQFRVFNQAILLTITGLLLAAMLAAIHPRAAALILAGTASALLLALLDRCRSRLTPLALRVAADLVLLSPIALLFR